MAADQTRLQTGIEALLAALAGNPSPDNRHRVGQFLLRLRDAQLAPDQLEAEALKLELALLPVDTLKARADEVLAALPGRGGSERLAEARALVLALRNVRDYTRMTQLAEAVCRLDPASAQTRRLYGQALIETGHATAAVDLLRALQQALPPAHAESAEAQGLLGRAHKQIYFDAVDRSSPSARRALTAAVAAYRGPYEADPVKNTWHGVNLLALIHRARREGWADLAPELDAGTLARQLAIDLRAAPRDEWTQPTLAEVTLGLSLASGELQHVEQQLAVYLQQPGLQAFQVASTLRQFTEVWGLGDLAVGQPGTGLQTPEQVQRARGLLQILCARLMQLPGGGVELAATEVQRAVSAAMRPAPSAAPGGVATPAGTAVTPALQGTADTEADGPDRGQLESILGVDGPQTYRWWLAGMAAAKSVGVVRQRLGKRMGTGFLVPARLFGLTPADEVLVLTNYHVVNPTGEPPGMRPEVAELVFEADDLNRAYAVKEIVWSSPRQVHDATLMRLAERPALLPALPVMETLPALPTEVGAAEPRVYVIGYPGGRELSFSFQDNALVDHEGPEAGKPPNPAVWRVHYRAPTEGGNSGSPVFASDWQVVALHHMGAGKRGTPRLNGKTGTDAYFANEGLAMATLVKSARTELAAAGKAHPA